MYKFYKSLNRMNARIASVRFQDGFVLHGWYSLASETLARSLIAADAALVARLSGDEDPWHRTDLNLFEQIHQQQHRCISMEHQHQLEEDSEKLYRACIQSEPVEIVVPGLVSWPSHANREHRFVTGPDSLQSLAVHMRQIRESVEAAPPEKTGSRPYRNRIATGLGISAVLAFLYLMAK